MVGWLSQSNKKVDIVGTGLLVGHSTKEELICLEESEETFKTNYEIEQ